MQNIAYAGSHLRAIQETAGIYKNKKREQSYSRGKMARKQSSEYI